MPHQHLGFQRLHRLQRHADNDDDGRTADGQIPRPSQVLGNDGGDGDDGQIERAEQGDLIEHLVNEVGGRLAGPESRG